MLVKYLNRSEERVQRGVKCLRKFSSGDYRLKQPRVDCRLLVRAKLSAHDQIDCLQGLAFRFHLRLLTASTQATRRGFLYLQASLKA